MVKRIQTIPLSLLFVAIFLWLQTVGAVHACEHLHEQERDMHQCFVCHVAANYDDLADFAQQSMEIVPAIDNLQVCITAFGSYVHSWIYHSRAPPVSTFQT